MIDEKFVVNIDNLGKIPLNEIARDFLERFNFKMAEPDWVERVGTFDIDNSAPKIGDIIVLSDSSKVIFNSVTKLSSDNWKGNFFIKGAMWRNDKWTPAAGYMYTQNDSFILFGNTVLTIYHPKLQFWKALLGAIKFEESIEKKVPARLKLTKALKSTNFGSI